jgi:hypothetical protein
MKYNFQTKSIISVEAVQFSLFNQDPGDKKKFAPSTEHILLCAQLHGDASSFHIMNKTIFYHI